MSEISYMPYKPGMVIKPGSSVFVFVDGVSVETFQKDEDFRSGTVSSVVAGKVRIEWDEMVRTMRGGMSVLVPKYEYVEKSRLTRVSRDTYVLDHKSVSPEKSADSADAADAPEMSDSTEKVETPDVPVQRSSRRKTEKVEKA